MSHPVSVGQQRFVIFKFVKKHPVHFAALVALGAAGAFLRLYFYFINRSLWLDEALLANFIVNRSFIGWFAPLSEQVVPIFFALLEKLAITIFGRSDWVLRLVPLLTGLAAIPIVAWVAKKYSGTWAVYSSLLLLILSPRLIYYSSEVKQYSIDVLFALLLLLTAAYCLEERAKPLPFVSLGLMGLLTGWLSHSGVFVFAGVWGSLGLAFALRKDKRRLIMMLMMGGGWAASLILVYFVALKDVTTAQNLTTYWTNSFAPLPPWSHLAWYYRALKGMLLDPAGLSGSVVLVGMLAVGVISMAFRHWLKMLILVSPFLITLAASALQKYPFNGRLLLFLVPLLFLLLAEAVQRVYSLLAKLNRPAAGLVALALLGGLAFNPFVSTVKNLQNPPMARILSRFWPIFAPMPNQMT
jgi:hypothetical protein